MISLSTLAKQRRHYGLSPRKRPRGRPRVVRDEEWQRQRDVVKARRLLAQRGYLTEARKERAA